MFGFFRRKKSPPPASPDASAHAAAVVAPPPDAAAAAPGAESSPSPAAMQAVVPAVPVVRAVRAGPAGLAAPAKPQAPEPVVPPPVAAEAPVAPSRASWFSRLSAGLARTRNNLTALFVGAPVDEALFEELETALITSDAGVSATQWLLDTLRRSVRERRITDASEVRACLRTLIADLMRPFERGIDIDRAQPVVMMVAGVNGAGKTTTIGKLARHLQREGKSVLLAAGDTFRAAAREQLAQWGARNSVDVISQQGGDPAAVAFDSVSAAQARGVDVVMIDTAGRLPTQLHLMDELRKVKRVIGKAMEGAPHEVLLVLDGNTGQNMLAQVAAFDEALALTGLIVTKLDGTAKGGALVALAQTRRERPIPVVFIGVGEAPEDLEGFSADEFAAALIG